MTPWESGPDRADAEAQVIGEFGADEFERAARLAFDALVDDVDMRAAELALDSDRVHACLADYLEYRGYRGLFRQLFLRILERRGLNVPDIDWLEYEKLDDLPF